MLAPTWHAARRPAAIALLAVAIFALGWLAGQAGGPHRSAPPPAGGTGSSYLDGLRAGEAEGIQQGRALQQTETLPAASRQPARAAFDAGYAAGANDVFGNYDGGWYFGRPYLVTLEPGSGGVTYRIRSRELVAPGVQYRLCPDGRTICR